MRVMPVRAPQPIVLYDPSGTADAISASTAHPAIVDALQHSAPNHLGFCRRTVLHFVCFGPNHLGLRGALRRRATGCPGCRRRSREFVTRWRPCDTAVQRRRRRQWRHGGNDGVTRPCNDDDGLDLKHERARGSVFQIRRSLPASPCASVCLGDW